MAKSTRIHNPSPFNLTAGEFDVNDLDKSKSTDVLYFLGPLAIDKVGQIQFRLNQKSMEPFDIIDWKGRFGYWSPRQTNTQERGGLFGNETEKGRLFELKGERQFECVVRIPNRPLS